MAEYARRNDTIISATNEQLQLLNATLSKLSEAITAQNGKIELTARDIMIEVSAKYPDKDSLTEGLNSVRTKTDDDIKNLRVEYDAKFKSIHLQGKLIWGAIVIAGVLISKGVDVYLALHPVTQN